MHQREIKTAHAQAHSRKRLDETNTAIMTYWKICYRYVSEPMIVVSKNLEVRKKIFVAFVCVVRVVMSLTRKLPTRGAAIAAPAPSDCILPFDVSSCADSVQWNWSIWSYKRNSVSQRAIVSLIARLLKVPFANNGSFHLSRTSFRELICVRAQIEKIKKDNEALLEQLNLASRSVASLENVQVAQQLARLAEQKEIYEKKIQGEQSKHKELDAQIKALQQKIQEERTRLGGVNAVKDHNHAITKQVKILENRLEKVLFFLPFILYCPTSCFNCVMQAMVKFNEALTRNRQLRELIDNLRRERLMFDSIYKKLERELNDKKTQMAQIIEVSNSAYEARCVITFSLSPSFLVSFFLFRFIAPEQ